MNRATMRISRYLVLMLCLLQGCGALFHSEQEERMRQEAEFAPFQQKNSIEGYREFIRELSGKHVYPYRQGRY